MFNKEEYMQEMDKILVVNENTRNDKNEIIEWSFDNKYELFMKLCLELNRKFGFTIAFGPYSKECGGFYSRRENRIVINNIGYIDKSVLAHELGHLIVKEYQLLKKSNTNEKTTFDMDLINTEIEEKYEQLQRYCFSPCIKAVEKLYGEGAFDIILANTKRHYEMKKLKSIGNDNAANTILTELEKNGYVNAFIKYLPIIKKVTTSICYGSDRNFVLTDLFAALFNFESLTREGHTFFYYDYDDEKKSNELFANLTEAYFTNRKHYDEAKQYFPKTVDLFEKIIEDVFKDLSIDASQYQLEPYEKENCVSRKEPTYDWIKEEKAPENLDLNGTLDDGPKVGYILQQHRYYKNLFGKNKRYAPYLKMYQFYHNLMEDLIKTGKLSEKEFSKLVNNEFIVPFYEVYKNPNFVEGFQNVSFHEFWKYYTPQKYVTNILDFYSKTKYDMVLLLFPKDYDKEREARYVKMVKKCQPDAVIKIGYWNYGSCSILFNITENKPSFIKHKRF